MTKVVLLVLFPMLCFVQPIFTDESIITSNGKILFYENSPATFLCKNSNATWTIYNIKITECNCPGKCGGIVFDPIRITAYCNGSSPVLHFNEMKLVDNYKPLKCFQQSSSSFKLLVGRRRDEFYPEKPFALVNNNYTLVCERKVGQDVVLYEENKMIATISSDNSTENMDKENFAINVDQRKIKLILKKVGLKDDGKIVGCYTYMNGLSLLNLTVNLQPIFTDENIITSNGKILFYENSPATFICKNSNATWTIYNIKITECNCPGKCGGIVFDPIRITAYCNGSSPVLHFKEMKLVDNYKPLKCFQQSSSSFKLLVGRRRDEFYPEKPFALVNNNYTLVCERKVGQDVVLYEENKMIATISSDNSTENMDKENFAINVDQRKIKLILKKVGLKDDGKIVGCYTYMNDLSLLNLTVNHAPEITLFYDMTKTEVECSANANPANITYEWVQKWGKVEKRRINGKKIVFQKLTYKDAGEWVCKASNGVPTNTGKKYSEKSVKVKVYTLAQFSGNKTQQAKIGHQKTIKICFYCYPEAELVEWHNEYGKISPNKSIYSSAEDGQFPFTGNCSMLTLHITEKSAKNYEFTVKNNVGKRKLPVTLAIEGSDESGDPTWLIVGLTIAALVIVIAAGIFCFKYHSYTTKKKAEKRNNSLHKSGDEAATNVYDIIGIRREGDEAAKNVYDILETRREDDDQVVHIYDNSGIQSRNVNEESMYAEGESPEKKM